MNRFLALAMFTLAAAAQDPAPVPPPVPPLAATVSAATDLWRRVLAMSEEEREAFISSKPASRQAYLRGKVREYLALTPAQREARLQDLELRGLMLPLMSMPADARQAQLQTLGASTRRQVEDRLRTWDILPPPLQKDVLENEAAIRLVLEARQGGSSREQQLANLSPQGKEAMEKNLQRFESLPASQQEQMIGNFLHFFGQPAEARNRALSGLSETDRARLTPTLSRFEKMSGEQREMALKGFSKFKSLSPADQQDFIRSAARWQAMSEKDRQLWRQLVTRIRLQPAPPAPPLPSPPLPKFSAAQSNH